MIRVTSPSLTSKALFFCASVATGACESKATATTHSTLDPSTSPAESVAPTSSNATSARPLNSVATPQPDRYVDSDGFAYLTTSKKIGDDSPGAAPTLGGAYERGLVAVQPDGRVQSIAMPGKSQTVKVSLPLRASKR